MAKKELEQDMMEGEEDAGVPRVYELSFHLEPELSETEAGKAYDALKAVVTEGGAIIAEGTPEKIPLAYTISRSENSGRRDFDSAYFCWIAYEAVNEGHEAVLAAVKAEKRVIRFLDIRTEKDVVRHASEMRELREKAPDMDNAERVSDAELDAALEGAAA